MITQVCLGLWTAGQGWDHGKKRRQERGEEARIPGRKGESKPELLAGRMKGSQNSWQEGGDEARTHGRKKERKPELLAGRRRGSQNSWQEGGEEAITPGRMEERTDVVQIMLPMNPGDVGGMVAQAMAIYGKVTPTPLAW